MEIIRQSAVASFVVVPLIDRANRPDYKASPTLAAGDVKIIRHTGGTWNYANPGTLPAIIGGSATKQVLITLTAAELTSDDLDYPIIVQFVDQTATKEWDDQTVIIWTKLLPVNAVNIGGVVPGSATIGTVTELTNSRAKYMHGAVWFGAGGTAGTVSYVNGIQTNPTSSIASAKTIADALLMKKFYIQSGNTVTLAATMDGYVFDGYGWILDLGGQAISNSVFMNARSVTGVSSSSSSAAVPAFIDCEFGATATIPAGNFHGCEFGGTVTLVGVNPSYDFIDCCSIVAGTSTPIFNVNSVANTNISFRRWSGGIEIQGISATTTISIDVVSGGTITLKGVDGNVQIRGMAASVDDQRTGSPTLGQNAIINQTSIPLAVWNALTSGMTTVGSIGKKLADWVVGTITANQAVNVAQWNGSNVVTPDVTGAPVVTVSGTKKTLDILNDLSAASVNTEVDTALTDIKLDHLVAVAESGDVVNSSIIAKLASKSATPAFTSFDNTTDSLEAIADGESPTTVDVTKINGSTTAAANLALSAGAMVAGAVDTTAFSPTLTTFETDITEPTTAQFKDRWVLFTAGPNVGSAKPIVSYSLSGGRGRFVCYAFPSTPTNSDDFIIV